MNLNKANKVGLLAVPALLALLAVPNASALDMNTNKCALDTPAAILLPGSIDTFVQADSPIVDVNTAALCTIVARVPAGACSYYSDDHYTSTSCIVAVDGLGVCYGWSYYHNYDSGYTSTSCYERVGL